MKTIFTLLAFITLFASCTMNREVVKSENGIERHIITKNGKTTEWISVKKTIAVR